METTAAQNSYVRQGTHTATVLANIEKYLSWCNNDSITVTIRPAPSMLTIGYYVDLLQYALQKGLIVKSNLCIEPEFMRIENLPSNVKSQYINRLQEFLHTLEHYNRQDFNASDPWQYRQVIREQTEMAIQLLHNPQPNNVKDNWHRLVEHCRKWDKIYNLDARKTYPELIEIWDAYGY
jgi:hypothetical protein